MVLAATAFVFFIAVIVIKALIHIDSAMEIVLLSSLRVLQGGVGLGQFLKQMGSIWVWVFIRMKGLKNTGQSKDVL